MAGELLRDWRKPARTRALPLRIADRIKYVVVTCLFNVFPMPQTSGFRRSFAYAAEAVDRGYCILVFPEGVRTTTGLMSPFRAGTGLLMKELNIPVVPVAIQGLFELKKAERRSARQGEVSVCFGSPILPQVSDDPAALLQEVEARVKFLLGDGHH
jgi:long-chain acyl-CoA synthetase